MHTNLKRAWVDSLFQLEEKDLIEKIDEIKDDLISQKVMDEGGNFIKPKERVTNLKK